MALLADSLVAALGWWPSEAAMKHGFHYHRFYTDADCPDWVYFNDARAMIHLFTDCGFLTGAEELTKPTPPEFVCDLKVEICLSDPCVYVIEGERGLLVLRGDRLYMGNHSYPISETVLTSTLLRPTRVFRARPIAPCNPLFRDPRDCWAGPKIVDRPLLAPPTVTGFMYDTTPYDKAARDIEAPFHALPFKLRRSNACGSQMLRQQLAPRSVPMGSPMACFVSATAHVPIVVPRPVLPKLVIEEEMAARML